LINSVSYGFVYACSFFLIQPLTNSCLNPAMALALSILQYALAKPDDGVENCTKAPDNFKPKKINMFSLLKLNYCISMKSTWIYVLGPMIGCIVGALFFYKYNDAMKRFRTIKTIEN
jgi:glycerol uptake facilitator-like aquaporin